MTNHAYSSLIYERKHVNLTSEFWLESSKKDLAAQLRRFNLGTQPRGLHADLRHAQTEHEHLRMALATPHPSISAQRALEPHWNFVFSNLLTAFQEFGVPTAIRRLVTYRRNVCAWFKRLQKFLIPIQEKLNRVQPPGPASVAAHVNSVFFYVLLLLTK